MIVEPTYGMITDILLDALNEFFDFWNIPHKYQITKHNYQIYYKRNWHTARLRSAEKPEKLTGQNLTDFILDEFDKLPYQKQLQVWKECIARIRKAEHSTGAVVTTYEGFKRTYELWEEKKNKGFILIKAKTTDNHFLPKDFIENLFQQYDSKLIQQYINAEAINIEADLVYYAFDRNKNLYSDGLVLNEIKEVILSFDFNINPMSAVIIYTDVETSKRFQLKEFKIPNSKTADVCEQAISWVEENLSDKVSVIITGDSSGNDGDTRNNISDYQIIAQEFRKADFSNDMGFNGRRYYMSVPISKTPVRERCNFVNNLFDKSLLYIHKDCVHSIKDREMVVWKKGAEQFKIDKSDKERTHLSDASDYGLWCSRMLIANDKTIAVPQDRRREY